MLEVVELSEVVSKLARDFEEPSREAASIDEISSSSPTTQEVVEPSGELSRGVEVPVCSPLMPTTREDVESSGETEQTTTCEAKRFATAPTAFYEVVIRSDCTLRSDSSSTSSSGNREAPIGVSLENFISVGVAQDMTPRLSPRPLEEMSTMVKFLKSMAKEKKAIFKKVRKALKKT